MQHNTTAVDVAYQFLHQNGKPMYFRDLISKVLETRSERVYSPAHAMAEIHTQINMDSRFIHLGKGMWGLVDWVPQRGAKNVEDSPAGEPERRGRREKLLEEIQQDYAAATLEPDDTDEPA